MDFEVFRDEEINRKQHVFIIYVVIFNFYFKNNIVLSREDCLITFSKHHEGKPDITNQKLLVSIFHHYSNLLFSKSYCFELIETFENHHIPKPIIYKSVPEDMFYFIVEVNTSQYLRKEGFHDYIDGYNFILNHQRPSLYQGFLVYLINELQLLLFDNDYNKFINDIYTYHYKKSID